MPCVHQFGIMPVDPAPEEEFGYSPENYPDMVIVDDDGLNAWSGRHYDALWSIPAYYNDLRHPNTGLAWYSITLIPPTSIPAFLDILTGEQDFADLAYLMHRAAEQNKYIIHYGI